MDEVPAAKRTLLALDSPSIARFSGSDVRIAMPPRTGPTWSRRSSRTAGGSPGGWQTKGRLADAWTTDSAADMLFALIASDVIEALIVDRRWSRRRLAVHLAILFRSTFAR